MEENKITGNYYDFFVTYERYIRLSEGEPRNVEMALLSLLSNAYYRGGTVLPFELSKTELLKKIHSSKFTNNNLMDEAFYNLLQVTPIFWHVYAKFNNKGERIK